MRIEAIGGPAAFADWLGAEPFIARSIRRGKSQGASAEVGAYVLAGRDLLWTVKDGATIVAAAVTQTLTNAPGVRECLTAEMGGEHFAAWGMAALRTIESYADKIGCKAVTFAGRKGWRRLLPEYAYVNGWYERAL